VKSFLQPFSGHITEEKPVWMMRQAGRYLPEYRALRQKVPDFLSLCYTPSLAAEVTMQPLRRFDLDAAIVFSDILVIPDAMGQKVAFEKGHGPVLGSFDLELVLNTHSQDVLSHLAPVFETLRLVRSELNQAKALIGFCGAPWTVATYMVGGKGSPDHMATRLYAREHPKDFENLLFRLADLSALYLIEQVRAGADAVQIFDSWSGCLDADSFQRFCVEPVAHLVRQFKAVCPACPVIGFPKGAGLHLPAYAGQTGVDGLGLDWTVPLDALLPQLPETLVTQGNLDPLLMVSGGRDLDVAIDRLLELTRNRPHIVNLGHGITPEGKIAHVEHLINRVKG
jgi:uroporphyrinogen decarboxylase